MQRNNDENTAKDVMKALGKFCIENVVKGFHEVAKHIDSEAKKNIQSYNDTEKRIWEITAKEQFQNKNYEKAERYYDKAISSNPWDADTWYNKGASLFNQKKYHEAIECFNKALNINPSHVKARESKEKAIKIMWRISM